jgi:ParB-like chromosome segregation protein Spo0J
MYINSIEDYLKWKSENKPVFIPSKKHGQIEIACVQTLLINRDLVQANNWNPNFVPREKMEQLEDSFLISGMCFPTVVFLNEEIGKFVISDGFHRNTMMGEQWFGCDYVPCVVRQYDENQRLVATMQFNKAKGTHAVDLDAELIRKLIEQGMTDEQIAHHFSMSVETVHRYKQLTGIAEIFKTSNYSMSWEMQAE